MNEIIRQQRSSPFDYGQVSVEQAMELRVISERLKVRVQRTAEEMLAMGEDLNKAKKVCEKDGTLFSAWCESSECPVGYHTAVRLMSIQSRLGSENAPGGIFEQGHMVLAEVTQTTDDEIRKALLAHVEKESAAGQAVSRREIEALKKALREEQQRISDLEDEKFEAGTALAKLKRERDELAAKKEQFAKDLIQGDKERRQLQKALKEERSNHMQAIRDERDAFEMSLRENRKQIEEELRRRPPTPEQQREQEERLRELRDEADEIITGVNLKKKELAELKAQAEDERKALRLRDRALDQFSKAAISLHQDALAIVGASELLEQIPITEDLYRQIETMRNLLKQALSALERVTRVDI